MYNPYLMEEVYYPVEEVIAEQNVETHPIEAHQSNGEQPTEGDAFAQFLKIKERIKPSDISFFKDFLGEKKEKVSKARKESSVAMTEQSGKESGFLDGILEKFHLDTIETGDILLVILVIYFMLEGDDKIELAITLGILAFFWWADHKKQEEKS